MPRKKSRSIGHLSECIGLGKCLHKLYMFQAGDRDRGILCWGKYESIFALMAYFPNYHHY